MNVIGQDHDAELNTPANRTVPVIDAFAISPERAIAPIAMSAPLLADEKHLDIGRQRTCCTELQLVVPWRVRHRAGFTNVRMCGIDCYQELAWAAGHSGAVEDQTQMPYRGSWEVVVV